MVVLVAADFGPGKALGMVADELRKRERVLNLGGAEKFHLPMDASIMVSGMAHNAAGAEKELAIIKQASLQGIPVGLYADTFDCAGRELFRSVREDIQFLFTPTEEEKRKAQEFFPNAKITATGNPLWESSAFPVKSRESVRKKFGLPAGSIGLLCPLRKEVHINREHLRLVSDALGWHGGNICPVVSVHPGDTAFQNDDSIYNSVLPRHSLLSNETVRDILPGFDVVVNAASGAGIEAIYQRLPVIDILTETVLDEVERLHSRRAWQPVLDGASIGVKDVEQIVGALGQILTQREPLLELREAQDRMYPRPNDRRQAARKIATLIKKYKP